MCRGRAGSGGATPELGRDGRFRLESELLLVVIFVICEIRRRMAWNQRLLGEFAIFGWIVHQMWVYI